MVRRLLHLEALRTHERVDIERAAIALIGKAVPEKVTITKALELYLSEIALDEVAGKFPEQRANYNKVKRRAVANFVNLNGYVDMRKLYRRYFEHIGEEERQNPFRNLRFSDKKMKTVKPFTNSFVRERIMQPSIFEGLNREAVLLSYALIETGCRPSELANIQPENIRLDNDVPHIRIRSSANRALKSAASVRDIPLVGVSLYEAFAMSLSIPDFVI